MSAASTLVSLHTVSRAGVAAASRLLRPEARHATTAENETATTGGGFGPRSGGFGPSRNPSASERSQAVGSPGSGLNGVIHRGWR